MKISVNPLELIDAAKSVGVNDLVDFAKRVESTGRNAAEFARYGGLNIDPQMSPYEVVTQRPILKVRHYFADDAAEGLPPIVLVPPLMMTADVFDVAPEASAVLSCHDLGLDVWVVDFGRPEAEPDGYKRNVADHVLALSDAVDEVADRTGRDVVLGGYSQGGMFSYMTAAYRNCDRVDSIVTFGTPVDWRAAPLPVPMSPDTFVSFAEGLLSTGITDHIALPPWFNKAFFRMLDPIRNAQFQINYFKQIHDREKLLPGEQQRRFLETEGWTAWSGPALAEMLRTMIEQNRMLEGGLVYNDRTVTLADLDCPILLCVGENDHEGAPQAARGVLRAAPRSDVYQLTLRAGHFGLVSGAGARKRTWPQVAGWLAWRAGLGELPDRIVPADQIPETPAWTRTGFALQVQNVLDLGIGVSATAARTVKSAVEVAQTVARERGSQVPLLNRLDALAPTTAISLGLLLDEAHDRDPESIALVFEDRAIRQREIKHRVDSVVKGLLSVGVRQGDQVGILMGSRPSAFSVLAAISRLGAVAVLLRPDGDLAAEAAAADLKWLVADPEHISDDPTLPGVRWLVLGGGSDPRPMPAHVTDLESVDVEKVTAPQWYRPNPSRGDDVFVVLFSGEGDRTRVRAITNRRWAISALGTASAAALKRSDTVYSATPLHHSSAILTAVGGAVAAGARLAMATGHDPETFWTQVRRYGVTHVSYTWASLREVIDGPPHPNEAHHPIRMFFGSGMPRNLWRRAAARFPSTHVVEFYASADGEAVLANVAGTKIGAAGRPLPGTAALKIAAFDAAERRLTFDARGLGTECAVGEVGLLLASCEKQPVGSNPRILRSVFARDDLWQATGDLFSRDADGDYWLVSGVDSLVNTSAGPVAPARIRNALSTITAVDLAVAYGVRNNGAGAEGGAKVVAAVSLLDGAQLNGWELQTAMRGLRPHQWPAVVEVHQDIPLTSSARPLIGPLRDGTYSRPSAVWELNTQRDGYHRADQ